MSYIYLVILKQEYQVDEEVHAFLEEHQMVLLHHYENLGLLKLISSTKITDLPYFLEAIELEKSYTWEEE